MTSPSSAPRPGVTWNTQLISTGEIVVDTDDGDSPFGWRDPDDTSWPGTNRPNRETRRALKRAARRTK